jgi:dihydroorotase
MVIGRVEGMGTLKVGAPADITILELAEQNRSFMDTRNHTRQGHRFIRPVAIVRAGQIFFRQATTVLPYP